MTQLYQIASQYNSIQQLAESDDESMLAAIADTMEGIEAEFQEKAVALVSMAFNIEADVGAIDAEIKRLAEKKKTIQAKSDWMRDYLKRNMEATGINKISCPLFSITLSAASKQVEITDESALPDSFVRVKTTVAPDKIAIAKALKEGEDVPGAVLVDGTRRLTIK